jgi:hypothetical protein
VSLLIVNGITAFLRW